MFNDQSFNDTLTNDIVSFEQLGPVVYFFSYMWSSSSFFFLWLSVVANVSFCFVFLVLDLFCRCLRGLCFVIITKTCLYNFDPRKPHYYIVKLELTGVNIIFLISTQNIDCGYSLEPPRRGSSNEYHNLCFEQKFEKYQNF